jgi:hypothetical protein
MHARGSWLPRAAAWPCRARGTGIPGPRHDAAAKGDGLRWRKAARQVPAQERHRGRGIGGPKVYYRGVIGITGSTRETGQWRRSPVGLPVRCVTR